MSDAVHVGREFFDRPILEVAPEVLGGVLRRRETDLGDAGDGVAIRITEVEVYDGRIDPASHAYRGKTARNATMFGPAGHLYCYFIYGMHHSLNMVCGPEGAPTGLLIRAGEVVAGEDLARRRRERRALAAASAAAESGPGAASPLVTGDGSTGTTLIGAAKPRTPMPHAALARGPGCVAQAFGATLENDGDDLFGAGWEFRPASAPRGQVRQGPRVGVSQAADVPWRFWLAGEPSVSAYRKATPRKRTRAQDASGGTG